VSFVVAIPEAFAAASQDFTSVGSAINEAYATAAASTTQVVSAAQDEVSTAVAALFGGYGREFHTLSAKAAAFHDQFVRALTGGASSYVEAEAANVLGLMGGATASGAAAAPGADEGNVVGFIFALLAKAFAASAPASVKFLGNIAPRTENFLEGLERSLIANAQNAHARAQLMRAQRIVANGLQLLGKDGALLYTDGREVVAIGGNFPYHWPYTEDFLYTWGPHIRASWGWTDQFMQSIFRTEIHVVERGEGLAQTYFQKVGNQVFLIDTDAEGQIYQRLTTTETSIAQAVQGLRQILGPVQQQVLQVLRDAEPQIRDLQHLEGGIQDARTAIEQAEQEYLRQAEQAAIQAQNEARQLDNPIFLQQLLVGQIDVDPLPAAKEFVEGLESRVAALIREAQGTP
ncbi:PE family protein, partial [Mycobacterium terramassiliense]